MMDYSAWLHRAETFMRSTNSLAGEWSLQVNIAPPLDDAEAIRLDGALPHGLPPFLRDFYTSASANPSCSYSWSPHGTDLENLAAIIPHQYSIYGGINFCGADELEEHLEQLTGFVDVFEELGGYGVEAAQVIRQCIPFIPIGNGDYIVLHPQANPANHKVLYVSHESDTEVESPLIPIANSPEEFLAHWPRIGYFGPEIWMLARFLQDSSSGLLDANCPLAVKWRAFMRTWAVPIEA